MLTSYADEIREKRRAARVFWGIVFLFAGFLYFFFQGYYPSIDFRVKELFSSGGLTASGMKRDLIRSFGIINISAKPTDAEILLGSGAYTSNEKRMTNYGDYSVSIKHEGYMPATMDFVIDTETPYYIDTVDLLPIVRYTQVGTGMTHIARSGDGWMAHTASGMIYMDASLSGSIRISSGHLTSIGEGYFSSGKTIVSYDSTKRSWESRVWSGATALMSRCDTSLSVRYGQLSCSRLGELITSDGKTLTGVLSIGAGYVEKADRIMVGSDFSKSILHKRRPERGDHIYIEKGGAWYTNSGGSLIALGDPSKWRSTPPIDTPLEQIEYAIWTDGSLMLIGEKSGERYSIAYDPQRESYGDLVVFPRISLAEIRIERRGGNTFYKTRDHLLFLYHNSTKIEWLIEGDILAFASEAALYRKDGVIWRADWSTSE